MAPHDLPPTPLWAVNALTFLGSIATGVIWAGVPFIAMHDYRYGKQDTLLLFVVMGLLYVVGAASAGTVLKRVERWLSPRAFLAAILVTGASVAVVPALFRGGFTLWLVAGTVNLLSSWLWPVVESYLTAGRHGPEMRHAIGRFNLTWTSSVAVSLLLMAPLVEKHARLAFLLVSGVYLPALAVLTRFERRPGAHDDEAAQEAVAPEYPLLLVAARMLLPLSYVLNSAMSALLPYALARLRVAAVWETPAAATWTIARIVAMAILARATFWHGRWGTLLVGGLTMTAGFGMVVAGGALLALLAGLAMLGVGMGVVYYAALYYGMAVGRAAVDAGGRHEALIGAGYATGPLAGLLALWISGGGEGALAEAGENRTILVVVWTLVVLCTVALVRPYRRARRLRDAS